MNCRVVSWIVVVVSIIHAANAAEFNYGNGVLGPNDWPNHYQTCAGSSQSPINIRKDGTTFDRKLKQFKFSRPASKSKFIVLNNGHSIQVNTEGDLNIRRGGLDDVYSTAHLHFHWGDNNQYGSEHNVDGVAYPLEMHIVNWNSKRYASIEEALKHPDGLAVLGVLFEITPYNNTVLGPVIESIQQVSDPDWNNRAQIPAISMKALLPNDKSRYYRYHGSLTTPLCQESVIWTVFEKKLPISERQMGEFRRCLTPSNHGTGAREALVNNYRPVQPLNGRVVYRSFRS